MYGNNAPQVTNQTQHVRQFLCFAIAIVVTTKHVKLVRVMIQEVQLKNMTRTMPMTIYNHQ